MTAHHQPYPDSQLTTDASRCFDAGPSACAKKLSSSVVLRTDDGRGDHLPPRYSNSRTRRRRASCSCPPACLIVCDETHGLRSSRPTPGDAIDACASSHAGRVSTLDRAPSVGELARRRRPRRAVSSRPVGVSIGEGSGPHGSVDVTGRLSHRVAGGGGQKACHDEGRQVQEGCPSPRGMDRPAYTRRLAISRVSKSGWGGSGVRGRAWDVPPTTALRHAHDPIAERLLRTSRGINYARPRSRRRRISQHTTTSLSHDRRDGDPWVGRVFPAAPRPGSR